VTLNTFLDDAVRRYGPRPALYYRPRYRLDVWTYAQLGCHATAVAAYLQEQGVTKGDRVVLWAPNSPWWVAAFFGIVRLGAVVVPLDLRSDSEYVRRVIGQTEPAHAVLGISAGWDSTMPSTTLDQLAQLDTPQRPATFAEVNDVDLAEIMFTSGTTGAPKGVMLTHGNIESNVLAVGQVLPSDPQYRLLSILPLSHMFEQTVGLLLPLQGGASILYASSRRPSVLLRELAEGGITTMLLVPQVLHLLLSAIEAEVRKQGKTATWQLLQRIAAPLPMAGRRLLFRQVHRRLGGGLQFLVAGGATLPPELAHKWELMGVPVLQGYGATEAAPVIAGTTARDFRGKSVGKAIPGVDLRIAADGEVLARGPNIMPGYWRNTEATAASFADGWYRTGDLGQLDRHGYLSLHGRLRDLIVLASGENVYPEDVEQALRSVPGVRDAVVVPDPNADRPTVHAVLLPDPASTGFEPHMVVQQANATLASHQHVHGHTVWSGDDFPRTHTLKVKRHEVLQVVRATGTGAEAVVAARSSPGSSERSIIRVLSQVSGISPDKLVPEAKLEGDVHLDSLGRVELLAAIEAELGMYIDDAQVGPDTTIADLEKLADAQQASGRPVFANWPLAAPARLARRAVQAVTFAALRRFASTEVSGADVLNTLTPPVLFVANHTSHLDSPTLLSALPPRWCRKVSVAAAADYFFAQALPGAAIALLLNAFPFSRTGATRPTIERCAWLFDHGWSMLLYPEGTRSVTGRMAAFKDGAGLLAVELGVPVVPVGIDGTFDVLPKGRAWPRPGRVHVTFGTPLQFGAGTPYHTVTLAMEAAVRALTASAPAQIGARR
jgi:long-chain acyl-CoA synthetase